MKRYLLLGILTFCVLALVRAPASLLDHGARQVPGLQLQQYTGTLWAGSAAVNLEGRDLGRLNWRIKPAALLRLTLVADLALNQQGDTVQGQLQRGLRSTSGQLRGQVHSRQFADLLANYDIHLPASLLQIRELEFQHRDQDLLPWLRGELAWEGGEVRYLLGSRQQYTQIPPLQGLIATSNGQPELSVYAQGDTTPLLLARIAADGWATIGITRQFTKLAGQPWQGDAPDHTVVLEVQEKLF